MTVLTQLRARLRPSAQDEKQLKQESSAVIAALNAKLKGAKAVLGGSGAKGTWSAGYDVDIFVMYQKDGSLSDQLEPVLKKLFPRVERFHGSRDYFQMRKGRVIFEIVPILKVSSAQKAHNITDVSPLHATWVRKKLSALQKDDVRVLKQFCKAQNIYGAESHISGFSGYVCEILIAKYGSFEKVMRAAAKWAVPIVIDVARHYRTAAQIERELDRAKKGPLIIIDPVQKDRNAAAAVSQESLSAFITAAKKYVKKPSTALFERKEKTAAELKKAPAGKQRVLVQFTLKEGKPDIAAAKALRAIKLIASQLERLDFAVSWGWQHAGETYAWFDANALPAKKVYQGPLASMKNHAAAFRKRHKNAKVKNGRLVVEKKREFRTLDAAVRHLLKTKMVREKIVEGKVR